MTIFYGARDLLDVTEAVTALRKRRRVRRWLRRHRQAVIDYTFAILFVLAILALAGLIDGGSL